jgi:hypothetical protein
VGPWHLGWQRLGELKGIGNVKSHYSQKEELVAQTPFHGVNQRARRLDGSRYLRKVRPFQYQGQQFGFGAFGDLSPDFDVPVQDTATTGARNHWRKMQYEAFGTIVSKTRKLLEATMMLAQARLVMDRIRWCGPQAAAAAERRKRARAQFCDPRYGAASLRNQHRFFTRLPSPFSSIILGTRTHTHYTALHVNHAPLSTFAHAPSCLPSTTSAHT